MRACIFIQIIFFTAVISLCSSSSLLDFLYWNEDASDAERRDESGTNDEGARSCSCDGPICMCCVDFNLTYIDLGGPGCVQMKYISQEEGLAVNVSYGDNLLHSEQVKGPNPKPTCMSLLVNLAEVCARFSDLKPHNDGLRGCLLLEPKLLGDVTTSFNIGCFTMDSLGMKLEDTNSTLQAENQQILSTTNSTDSESQGINEEELIAAVNESAEQGLAFFGNLLGLTFAKPEANETNSEYTSTTTPSNANHLSNNNTTQSS